MNNIRMFIIAAVCLVALAACQSTQFRPTVGVSVGTTL